ncbi:uncharacterized protein LOC123878767 [Maniola jurtina]|uniref:uncharacterized protein LOC123878767 n=1 Tax=Maniola jurtina TaxID=191418 RepID=UPI001E68B922|nr:uncharacterized protein LOC123878767 [Maniola jurtina]
MAKQTFEVGTVTLNNEVQRIREIYKKCELLNVIQHIDIYGKIRSNYTENRKVSVNDAITVSSVSCFAPQFSKHVNKPGLDEKLSKLSMSTKVSGLYPGNDILSKKTQNRKLKKLTTKTSIAFGTVVSR